MNNLDSIIEPFRDIVNRTPSEVIPMGGRFEIHHYKTSSPPKFKTPILIVGSLINRHYILDFLPQTSIIRHFQLSILEVLKEGETTTSEIVKKTGQSQSNISNHLSCLLDCGLVSNRREGKNIL
jgi:DNA-binding transcriptional ArsR family regulator